MKHETYKLDTAGSHTKLQLIENDKPTNPPKNASL